MRLRMLCGMLVLSLVSACGSTATISKPHKELLDKLKAKETTKAELQQQPAKFILAGAWPKREQVIINHYSKAPVYFVNKSEFDVSAIEGRLVYTDTSGAQMDVPFQAEGDVRSGWAKRLNVSAAQDISGAAVNVRIVVEKVRVLSE